MYKSYNRGFKCTPARTRALCRPSISAQSLSDLLNRPRAMSCVKTDARPPALLQTLLRRPNSILYMHVSTLHDKHIKQPTFIRCNIPFPGRKKGIQLPLFQSIMNYTYPKSNQQGGKADRDLPTYMQKVYLWYMFLPKSLSRCTINIKLSRLCILWDTRFQQLINSA
jgi:hypothetical protein